ncbi:ABC-2 type transport system permease protein [Cellulosimicrobium cellulans]|uniref:hypothetical protein n=1 Tax=Cellulosimicrobium cellulans TaxID=1710 RepID=UPI00195E506E|nr:hypothetical protein [Cellulosimicrobium cellulans]MBM7820154.1 ABC-2 type transport system permease protein [Cellulosimicrobium cellulans]
MAATTQTPAVRTGVRPQVTLRRVLAAEWDKLTSLRATGWLALATVAAAAASAWALGLFVRPDDGASGAPVAVAGYVLAQLGFLVLGATTGAGEFRTGTARVTFVAVPRRIPVLLAQVLVTTAAAALTAAVALGAALAAPRAATGLVLDVADPETARLLGGFVLYQTGVALVGLGLGALLRRPDAALVTGVVLVVVLDHLLATNPGRVADTARALLPGVGTRLLQGDERLAALDATTLGPHLGPWAAGLVLAAWAAVLLVAAGYRLRRRDVT